MSAVEQLDLGVCLAQEGTDQPMTQDEFLAQTPARCGAARRTPPASAPRGTYAGVSSQLPKYMQQYVVGSGGGCSLIARN